MVYIPGETPLEKNSVFICKWLSVEDSFWLKKGAVSTSLITGTSYGLDLCRACACSHSLFESYELQFCVQEALFLWCALSVLAFTIFQSPLPECLLSLKGERFDGDIPFMTEFQGLSFSQTLSHCGFP